jgi:hypothetical protein
MAKARVLPVAVLAVAVYGAALLASSTGFVAPGAAASRREAVLGGAAGAAAAATLGAEAAYADWQGEPAKMLSKYGPAVLALKDDVEKGDLEAVLKKENKFKLLNGFYRNSPFLYKKQVGLTEDLLDAADQGKKDEVKKLYSEYIGEKSHMNFAKYPPPKFNNFVVKVSAMSQ